jgi:hypothetical protein
VTYRQITCSRGKALLFIGEVRKFAGDIESWKRRQAARWTRLLESFNKSGVLSQTGLQAFLPRNAIMTDAVA